METIVRIAILENQSFFLEVYSKVSPNNFRKAKLRPNVDWPPRKIFLKPSCGLKGLTLTCHGEVPGKYPNSNRISGKCHVLLKLLQWRMVYFYDQC